MALLGFVGVFADLAVAAAGSHLPPPLILIVAFGRSLQIHNGRLVSGRGGCGARELGELRGAVKEEGLLSEGS